MRAARGYLPRQSSEGIHVYGEALIFDCLFSDAW